MYNSKINENAASGLVVFMIKFGKLSGEAKVELFSSITFYLFGLLIDESTIKFLKY
jgi:hypothetical protein